MVSPCCTVMAVPPSQFQPAGAVLRAAEPVTSLGPAARLVGRHALRAAGGAGDDRARLPARAALGGGGSGALWIAACLLRDRAGHLAGGRLAEDRTDCRFEAMGVGAATDRSDRNRSPARRGGTTRSERPGSSTQRIGFPTRTQQDKRRVNSARVNKRLRMKDSFNPNQTPPKFRQMRPLVRHNSRACPGNSGTKRTAIRFSRSSPVPLLVSLTNSCGAAMRPERQHHDAAVGQLRDQRRRNALGRRRDDDAVVGRAHRLAAEAVADQHLDVVVAERLQPRPRARSASVR